MNLLSGIMRVLVFGVVLGALASLAALAFVDGVKWLNDFARVTFRSRQSFPSSLTWLLIFPPVLAGLIAGGLIRFLPDKRPHNPADVIEAAQSARPIPLKTGALTAFAAMIGIGGGASLGVYAPLTHLGATVGSSIAKYCKAEPGLGIGCGVAAAISTAFSAPIAGIIFAHEVVLRHYSLRAFAPITVASSTGLIIADQIFHRPPLFEISVARAVFAPEFFAFVVIGVGGALVAVVFMRAVLFSARIAGAIRIPLWQKPALAGLCIGVAALWIPEILGTGIETLRFAITPGAYTIFGLTLILIAKVIATALCLGFGFAGGIFSPALLIGVLFGAALGHIAENFYGGAAGLEFYAICGMVAVTSPVIGAPLATILLVFELTRNYTLTTAAMVSVAFSNLVAYRLFGRSMFDRQLRMRGFDLSMGRDKMRLAQLRISDLIETEFVHAKCNDTAAEIMQALINANHSEAYITAGDKYVGMITLNQLLSRAGGNTAAAGETSDATGNDTVTADETSADTDETSDATDETSAVTGDNTVTADKLARDDSLHFDAGMSVWDAMEAMEGFVGESIPVLDAQARLIGVVHESALVAAYLRTVRALRAEENADR